MRTANSIRNIVLPAALTLATSLTGFISRTIFIKILGSEYLGINGVMGNVLSMLSIAEMGVSMAIGFSLYKPLAEKDVRLVSALMSFYRRAYMAIAGIVALAGLVLVPFLTTLVKTPQPIPHLHLIYLMFLTNTVAGYFLVYPQTLMMADQKGYRTVPIAFGFNLLWTVLQAAVLFLTRNYIAYLSTQFVVTIGQQYFTNRYIRKCYPWADLKSREKLPAEDLARIKTNVGAMLWHKIGDFCVNGTANLIISARISVALVGLYSNYVMIIGMVKGLLMLVINSVTPSFGNLIATESRQKCLQTSRVLDFLAFWLFGLTTVCFYNLLNPFIELWIGRDYCFSKAIVSIILLDYYLTGARIPLFVAKSSGGIYAQDKYVPILQAAVNLVVSLVLAKYMGIAGVLLGMIFSTYCFPFWYRSVIVYRHVFGAPVGPYFVRYGLHLSVVAFNVVLTAYICSHLSGSGWLVLIERAVLSLVVPNVVVVLLFGRGPETKQLLDIAQQYLSARRPKWIPESV